VEAGAGQPTPPSGEPKPAPRQASSTPGQPPPTEQRIEDMRAWVAQLDRKLGVRTYALGAVLVLALAAGIVGVVLALSAKDESATKDEVRSLRDQVEAVQQEASEAAEEDVATITDQLDALEGRVNTIAGGQRTTESELSVVQDDIDDLRNQISGLESSGGGGGANNP
jgi:septal ring factor EnvC (AmiA/AmiB activator)